MSDPKVLIIGARGQIGTELTTALRLRYGVKNVVAADIADDRTVQDDEGIYEHLNVLDKATIRSVIDKYEINQIYLLAAVLSAKAEDNPNFAWGLNMKGLFNICNIARDTNIRKIFWPSSIAIFGATTPRERTPQLTITEPSTVYGISKLAGERWVEYYHKQYGLDVRSLRFPGLISWKTRPGGGTTDYAVDIFYQALEEGKYECFLNEDTRLPMMYMPDAIRSVYELMEADSSKISVRSSYNLGAIDFTPAELAKEIKTHIPDFSISYEADFRQSIADTWPMSIDDSQAANDWGWKPEYDLSKMTADMLANLKKKLT